MAERQTQGSESQALDPELIPQLKAELDRARRAREEIEAAREEIEPAFDELDRRMSDLQHREEVLAPHIEALEVLLGERPFTLSGPPADDRREPGKRSVEDMLRPKSRLKLLEVPRRRSLRSLVPSPEAKRQWDADLVVALLDEIGRPLHYRDIHRELEERGHRVGGADPASTLLSRFFKDPRLYRPRRGTYGLVEWQDRENEQPADAPANARSGLGDVPKARLRVRAALDARRGPPPYGALNVAYAVLRAQGEPMHYQALASEMLETGWWTTTGSKPSRSVNAYLSKDIKDNGDESRFIRVGRGFYGLREPDAASEAAPEAITEGDEHE